MRRRIARIGRGAPRDGARRFATGHAALDAALGGGLAYGRIHELFATESGDAGAAAGFAAMLALRACAPGRSILWLRADEAEGRSGRFYAPGFAALGGSPRDLVVARAPDPVALLRAAGDAARCAGAGAIVVECPGAPRALDLTASRRLALAAERSGAVVLLVRDAEPAPSAAETRWSVAAAPSAALAADAPGRPALELELLRRRAGSAGMRWRVEWDSDERCFCEPALSGAVFSVPFGGPDALRAAARG